MIPAGLSRKAPANYPTVEFQDPNSDVKVEVEQYEEHNFVPPPTDTRGDDRPTEPLLYSMARQGKHRGIANGHRVLQKQEAVNRADITQIVLSGSKNVISPGKARTFNLLMCDQARCG